jgi:hypothetical protein
MPASLPTIFISYLLISVKSFFTLFTPASETSSEPERTRS